MGTHAPPFSMHILTVDVAEHGLKLISFLARRLEDGVSPDVAIGGSTNELHRWIRTGQVRVNGKRATAFGRVAAGDSVRLPPFAAIAARHEAREIPVAAGGVLGGKLRVLAVTPEFLALEKPAGLPTQPGSKHNASVSGILRDHFSGSAYIPAPAHRLDKLTSGILLAGRTHEAQKKLHELFARRDEASMEKAYLAWVYGVWPFPDEQTLSDRLAKEERPDTGYEAVRESGSEAAREARSRVSLLAVCATPFGKASLLRVVLETGRTHQIRVQLAIRNFPIIGDMKYGGKPFSRMLLHAYSLAFLWDGETVTLVSPPPWPEPFTVALPPLVA